MTKKLYRSATDKKISGVCAGVAEYLGIDPTVIRLIWLLFSLGGPGVIAYIVCVIIIPENPLDSYTQPKQDSEQNFN